MKTGFTWEVTPQAAFTALFQWQATVIYRELVGLMTRYAALMESWMKENAVWADRTGNARQTLYTEVKQFVGAVVVELGYGVDYDIYLEFANQGRFSIINPAIDHFLPLIRQDLKAMLS